MRQVPVWHRSIGPRLGLIGQGRLARHLAHYFSQIGQSYLSLPIGKKTNLELIKNSVGFEKFYQGSDLFLILVSDDAILKVKKELFDERVSQESEGKIFVHMSGALQLEDIPSFHPLMTFSGVLDDYPLEIYQKMAFVGEKKKDEGFGFRDLFPFLKNPYYEIDSAMKPYYHALCVVGGNLAAILIKEMVESFEQQLNLPPQIAESYLLQMLKNRIHSPQAPITGPMARGDLNTMLKNSEALRNYNPRLEKIYQQFKGIYR